MEFFVDSFWTYAIDWRQFFELNFFVKRERKSVRIGCGRATVTGYETSNTTLRQVEGEGEGVGLSRQAGW